MDKERNNRADRTDLMAAGRKMLYQFQKNKEKRSSSRRQVKKSDKPEECEEADSVMGPSITGESIQQPYIEPDVSSVQFLVTNLLDGSENSGTTPTNDCYFSLSESIDKSSSLESHSNQDRFSDTLPATAVESSAYGEAQVKEVGTTQESEYSSSTQVLKDFGVEHKNSGLDNINCIADITRTSPSGRGDPDYSFSPAVELVEDSMPSKKIGIHGEFNQEETGDKMENTYRNCSASPHSLCEPIVSEEAVSGDHRSKIKKLLIRCSDSTFEEIPVELEETELQYLIKLTELSSCTNLTGILDDLEMLREQCFLSDTSRDFLFLQFSEQSEKMAMLQKELTEVREKNESLSEEPIHQSTEIHAARDRVREQMQFELDSAASAIESFSSRVENLEMELGKNREMALISSDFAQSSTVVKESELERENLKKNLYLLSPETTQLEIENDQFSDNISGVMDGESGQLIEQRQHLAPENEIVLESSSENNSVESLKAEICELKERLSFVTGERVELEEGKHMLSIELCVIFEVMSAKLEECMRLHPKISEVESEFNPSCNTSYVNRNESTACNRCCLHTCEEREDEADSSSMVETFNGPVSVGMSYVLPVGSRSQSDAVGFFQRALKAAKNTVDELDMTIKFISSNSNFVRRSGGEAYSIQDYGPEVHFDEQKPHMNSAVYGSLDEHIFSAKQHIRKIKAVLAELGLYAIKGTELFNLESEDLDVADVSLVSNCQYEALNQHGYSLEAAGNMESEAFSGALNQFFYDIQTMNNEFLDLCGTSREQYTSLKGDNAELTKKLNNLLSRISKLQDQSHMIRLNFDALSSTVCYQLENFKREVDDRTSLAEHTWMCIVSQISTALHRLDASVCESPDTNVVPPQDALDIASLVDNSVCNATIIIEKLQEKLEAAHAEIYLIRCSYADMNKKYQEFVYKVHGDIWKLVDGSGANKIDDELVMEIRKSHDLLYYQGFEIIFEKLRNVLQESLQLKSLNETLEVELIRQNKEVDELRKKILDVDDIWKMIRNQDLIKAELELEGGTDAGGTPISYLKMFMSSLKRKYKEANEAKSLYKDELEMRVAKANQLNKELDKIFSSNMISEIEIFFLKACFNEVKAFLDKASFELHQSITEREQSELRLTVVREKLGIAVNKGKGLIGQRDHLKKLLAEASDDMKRISEDVNMKDKHILAIETKLCAYSEAAERVEALESELSCMSNSTAVLRESFLLNDSRLRTIEEILEETDLPDNFKCTDMVEKVKWLARSVSLSMHERRDDSFDGVSRSDSTLIVTDSFKEDTNENISNNDSETYEELQNKFHELTEQNEMLEQSLQDRNNLIQMWDNLLNRINAPSQLETMEMEDRIEWFGCAFLEADHIAAMLQLKIENLESYCKSLAADLDESRGKTSDLETALHEECLEKDHIEEKVELLMNEYELVAEREMVSEIMAGVLKQGICSLREMLFEKNEKENQSYETHLEMCSMIGNVWQDLFNDTGILLDVDVQENLEVAVMKLIEKFRTLSSMKASIMDIVSDGRGDRTDAFEMRGGEEREIVLLRKYMEDASKSLSKALEDKDAYMVNNCALVIEIEVLSKRCEELQAEDQEIALLKKEASRSLSKAREDRDVYMEKNNALAVQIEDLSKKCEELQGKEQEIILLKEFTEEASRSLSKSLEDRDAYIVKNEALVIEIKSLSKRCEELQREGQEIVLLKKYTEEASQNLSKALEDRDAYMAKNDALLADIESLSKRCEELQADEQEVALLKKYTEEASMSLSKALEDRDSCKVKNDAFVVEIRSLSKRCEELQVEEKEIILLKKSTEEASRSLSKALEDRDAYLVKNDALVVEIEALSKRCDELQGLHTMEEQKTASAREKLNVAVRKGKSLVQQRDNLKQTVEELNVELNHRQIQIDHIQNSVVQYEQKMEEFTLCQGRAHTLEVQNLALMKQVESMEHCLQEKQHSLDIITCFLDNFDVGNGMKFFNSLDKLEELQKLFLNLQLSLDASQDESGKSRKEAELLTAELDAVKERSDRLVEELNRTSSELLALTRERDEEEASKLKALSLVEQLSTAQSDNKNKMLFEFTKVTSSLNLLTGGLSDLRCEVDNVTSKDLDFLRELDIGFRPYLESSGNSFSDFISSKYENKGQGGNVSDSLVPEDIDDVVDICAFVSHNLERITAQVYSNKEILMECGKSFTEAGMKLSGMFEVIQREMTCQKELVDCMKKELIHMGSVCQYKDSQVDISHRCISILHEACVTAIQCIYNKRILLFKSNPSFRNMEMGAKYFAELIDMSNFANIGSDSHSEEHISETADRMLTSINDFLHLQDQAIKDVQKEMRCTISNLQEVLQNKEIENERINRELTAQINEADSSTTSYKTRVIFLESELGNLEEQQKLLGKKAEDAHKIEVVTDLQEKVRSLTEALIKKEQEIDALAQALDVEEAEMEELKVAMGEVENKSRQKTVDLTKLERLHAKSVKKLSITVSKFDEIYLFSKHLLAEMEELLSKLHGRDAEVSFLRQEVTRCAKEALTSPGKNEKNSGEIQELFWCVYSMLSVVSSQDANLNGHERDIPTREFKQILENQIAHIVSELERLRIGVQSHEMLLADKKQKVQDRDVLEISLSEK